MKYTYKLPNKPSELIRKALEDMEQVEKMPGYRIDLETWHDPSREVCEVCLAGATMVVAGLPKDEFIRPNDTDDEINAKLCALNEFRDGYIYGGLYQLDIEDEKLMQFMDVTEYSVDPNQFKEDMRSIADYLESNGY